MRKKERSGTLEDEASYRLRGRKKYGTEAGIMVVQIHDGVI